MEHHAATATFGLETTARLRDAFGHAPSADNRELTGALNAMCIEAHFRRMSPQAIEVAMRVTWAEVTRPDTVSEVEWSRAYYAALGQCLTSYYAMPL